jgi:hypothetical protein
MLLDLDVPRESVVRSVSCAIQELLVRGDSMGSDEFLSKYQMVTLAMSQFNLSNREIGITVQDIAWLEMLKERTNGQ